MCGICGMYRFDRQGVEKNALVEMTNKMIHRGPDDAGYLIDHHLGLAMRRLSIIDIHGGRQPISNESGTIHIVLNGEVYNYVELRKKLIHKGHRFKTETDTEVIIHLYEDEGMDSVHQLNGMFAFALWDSDKDLLWIVRDRVGIKPLFYAYNKEEFIFSSQLNSLTCSLKDNVNISATAFLKYLGLSYVPYPDTIYENVYKLEPGHWLEVRGDKIAHKKYWSVDKFGRTKINLKDAKRQLLEILSDSISLQKRSDVPVGTFLSGGVDSSAVVALLSLQIKEPVNTFSVDFEGKTPSELPFARMVAERYRTNHREVLINKEDLHQILDEFIPYMDEPFSDSAFIPSYMLSKIARESGIKVILNGTGGDEIFGGYGRYGLEKGPLSKMTDCMPEAIRHLMGAMFSVVDKNRGLCFSDNRLAFGRSISDLDLGMASELFHVKNDYEKLINILKSYYDLPVSDKNAIYPMMYQDFKNYMVGDVLSLLDKTTMACSIEGRVPLLDHRLVEFAYGLPEEINLLNRKPKGLFKSVLEDFLPAPILNREKMGFNPPTDRWVVSLLLQRIINSVLDNPNPFFEKMLHVDKIKHYMSITNNKRSYAETLFSLYVFDLWYKKNYSH